MGSSLSLSNGAWLRVVDDATGATIDMPSAASAIKLCKPCSVAVSRGFIYGSADRRCSYILSAYISAFI